jgi:two-component system NtrC family sensor kinase
MSEGSDHFRKGLPKRELPLEEKEQELAKLREQLVRQNKMAALGTLLAGVAHDINTPLGSVKANADLAQKLAAKIRARVPEGDAKLARSLDALDDAMGTLSLAAERIHVIVGSLRTFVRQDGTELTETNLHQGLDSSLQLVSHMFERRITAEKRYGEIPVIRCRPGELNQVFMNLLTNAAQAIEGEGTITVTTRRVDDHVEIAIEDDGVGISEQHQARLFEPGFTTKEAKKGTGLGLAITSRIVREHGGTMDVTSKPGDGSCFTIRLPLAGPPSAPDSDD